MLISHAVLLTGFQPFANVFGDVRNTLLLHAITNKKIERFNARDISRSHDNIPVHVRWLVHRYGQQTRLSHFRALQQQRCVHNVSHVMQNYTAPPFDWMTNADVKLRRTTGHRRWRPFLTLQFAGCDAGRNALRLSQTRGGSSTRAGGLNA
jgi:hypothetical protein